MGCRRWSGARWKSNLLERRGLLADIEAQERQLAPVVNAVQGIMRRTGEFTRPIPRRGRCGRPSGLPEVDNLLKQVLPDKFH